MIPARLRAGRVLSFALAVAAATAISAPRAVLAADALVAVAANFAEALNVVRADFQRDTEHRITVVLGSTGKLYAQIVNGAPYDLMMAADQARPERLEMEGRAVAGSRFTYATGRLALWSRDAARVASDGELSLIHI